MATVEAVNSHLDGDYLHAAEIKNWRQAMGGGGIVGHSLTLTVTEANRVITVPAFNAWVPNGSGGLVYVAHAGANVNVTASASNPRMDLLTLDSSGNLGMADGVATAETGDVEEAPTTALDDDEILIAVVRNPANQAAVLAADIRGRGVDISESGGAWKQVGSNTTEQTMTSATAGDLVTITGLTIPVDRPVKIVVVWRKSAVAAQLSIGLKLNSTVVAEADTGSASGIGITPATNEVQSGYTVVEFGPRSATYLTALIASYMVSGASGITTAFRGAVVLTNALPNAVITDVIIRGDSDGSATLAVKEVYVYQG